jgi:hypothetical protein
VAVLRIAPPRIALALALALALVANAACSSDPKPSPKTAHDGVPANSSAESRLSGAKRDDEPDSTASDPTQPLMTPMGRPGGSAAENAAAGGDDDAATTPGAKKPKPDKKGPVSKQECNEALDHGMDLMLAEDARFQGVPPEMRQELKSQALKEALREHADQNPCVGKGISRAEYDCEMAAMSMVEFTKCDKDKKRK